ncbi:M56 family metallopeptidase [Blautia sp. HCP3S3_H10_1]|uniref:M56 family metallopeptidase n=1 Tax=unclassified Blautia TaxID=2648079 RepID=UPI003F928878
MLLICMSIAGTMPLLLCVLLMLITRKRFNYRLGRKLVFLSLAGYLIPFQVVKYLMPLDVLEETNSLNAIVDFVNLDNKEAISYSGISVWMSDQVLMIILCWLFLITGFSIYQIIKYQQLTRKLKRITDRKHCFLSGIGNVEYRISPQIGSPYTIGFASPFIVVPESLEESRLSEMILRHEYSHLRHHDSAVKLLSLLIICLHFFNPFAWLTLYLYTRFSEYIADEAATKGFTREECKVYASALVAQSGKTRQVPVVWRSNLLGGKFSIRRRVDFIMMKHKKASKIGTAAAILGSVILSGSTAFAYAPAQTTRTESNTSMTTFESVNFSSNQESSNLWTDSRIIFTDSNDSTTLIDANNLETRAIICTHVYESGYADTHTSKSNGGCVVRTYKAKRCLKCNDIVFGELLNTVTYAKCIHK